MAVQAAKRIVEQTHVKFLRSRLVLRESQLLTIQNRTLRKHEIEQTLQVFQRFLAVHMYAMKGGKI